MNDLRNTPSCTAPIFCSARRRARSDGGARLEAMNAERVEANSQNELARLSENMPVPQNADPSAKPHSAVLESSVGLAHLKHADRRVAPFSVTAKQT